MQNSHRQIGEKIFYSTQDELSHHLFCHADGVVFIMSAELEFYIDNDKIIDIEDPEFNAAFEKIKQEASDHDIRLECIEEEDGPNQFEVQIQPHDQLAVLCDKILITKSLLTKHLKANFDPKPHAAAPGSSLHCHISLYDAVGNNLFAKPHHNAPYYQSNLYQAIGGILQYMPASMPIFAPTEKCYQRYKAPVQLQIHKHYPTNLSWGINNRTCAIRIPKSHIAAPGDTRLEHRVPSIQADPYLTLGNYDLEYRHGHNAKSQLPRSHFWRCI